MGKHTYPTGLGTWAPMHLEYDLAALRSRGLTRFVAQVGESVHKQTAVETIHSSAVFCCLCVSVGMTAIPCEINVSGIDEAYCFNGRYDGNGGFATAPWMCKDVAEFASATVSVTVDGSVVQQSPVLRLGEGVWPFDVRFTTTAKRLRILILRGPVAQGGKVAGVHGSREWVTNQDACE